MSRAALIGDPELLFLDEPTTGFDLLLAGPAWDVIAGLRDLGKTIFLTTHYMDEAEKLADRINVIAHGRIVASGTAKDLGGRLDKPSTIRFSLPEGFSLSDLPPVILAAGAGAADGAVEVTAASPLPLVGALAAWADGQGVDLPDLQVRRPTLEEVYLELTEEVR